MPARASLVPLVRYLCEHGPQPRVALKAIAALKDNPIGLAPSSLPRALKQAVLDGLVVQRGTKGDYYPARHPDTDQPVFIEVLDPDEKAALEMFRAQKSKIHATTSSECVNSEND